MGKGFYEVWLYPDYEGTCELFLDYKEACEYATSLFEKAKDLNEYNLNLNFNYIEKTKYRFLLEDFQNAK